ncbi:phospho-N-acetylmuramoyl-pentapeptide-transferase [Bacillus sp. 2205SS5-2]|uniref:phospho-N-acetylmuramoyl-pentapeptide- transferase n=1 Tax=Bacillus sp. 2205SS5-2 TaxID=3109031 RepID=UPI003005F485
MVQFILPAILSFILISSLSPFLIFILKKWNLIQPIRDELPEDQQEKRGTPLMLGLVFFIGTFISVLFSPTLIMIYLVSIFVLFGSIGFADDWWKASKQNPAGISGKTKLILQFGLTITFLLIALLGMELPESINITDSIELNMPLYIYLSVISLYIVGTTNAINFTDGMDGLLGMVAIPSYFFFFFISDSSEVQLFSIVMGVSLVGFLIYNIYPAKAFMGDTGSMAIGGSLAFLAVIEKVEVLIPLLFFVYLAEQLSVIVQVFIFKKTGKRLFRMTPIHYHFSLKYGWTENVIVVLFTVVSWICMGLSLLYFTLMM